MVNVTKLRWMASQAIPAASPGSCSHCGDMFKQQVEQLSGSREQAESMLCFRRLTWLFVAGTHWARGETWTKRMGRWATMHWAEGTSATESRGLKKMSPAGSQNWSLTHWGVAVACRGLCRCSRSWSWGMRAARAEPGAELLAPNG